MVQIPPTYPVILFLLKTLQNFSTYLKNYILHGLAIFTSRVAANFPTCFHKLRML